MSGLFQSNEVILITGGASGLGRILVDMCVREGAKVAFTYRSSKKQADRIVEAHGEKVFSIQADASDFLLAQDVVQKTIRHFGRIDALVNNAASAKDASFLDLAPEEMEYTWRNTFLPTFNYTKAVAGHFSSQKKGSIVQIGSINGERGREGSASYCSAKAAIMGLSKTVAKELGPYGVSCNVVSPGYIATDGQTETSPLIKKLVLDECAIRRLTEPEEVGNLVMFLASEKAKNITGQIYRIDCGQYI